MKWAWSGVRGGGTLRKWAWSECCRRWRVYICIIQLGIVC